MDAYYGYDIALWYWRTVAPRHRSPTRVMRTLTPDSYARTERQELECRPDWLDPELLARADGAIHCLVFHQCRRKSNGELRWHLWGKVPRDAFSPAGPHSLVASPELCFLQMASVLEFNELVLLGMELCGLYCLDPGDPEGFARRTAPLTNRARIAAFLEENNGARGHRKAQMASRYILDGAASPMEAAVAMLLTLPNMRGGYHLPAPSLNYRIDLSSDAAKLAGKTRCYGDICWPNVRLDVEYLGLSSHEANANMLSDRSRTLAIEEMGFEVIEITHEQATDIYSFDIVARRIAAKLGKRLRKEGCGPTAERRRLFDVLYSWNTYKPAEAVDEDTGAED